MIRHKREFLQHVMEDIPKSPTYKRLFKYNTRCMFCNENFKSEHKPLLNVCKDCAKKRKIRSIGYRKKEEKIKPYLSERKEFIKKTFRGL